MQALEKSRIQFWIEGGHVKEILPSNRCLARMFSYVIYFFGTRRMSDRVELSRVRWQINLRNVVAAITALVLFGLAVPGFAQDWVKTGTSLGVEKVRLA